MDTNERLRELESRKQWVRDAMLNHRQIQLDNAARERDALKDVEEAQKDLFHLADELGVSRSSLNLN